MRLRWHMPCTEPEAAPEAHHGYGDSSTATTEPSFFRLGTKKREYRCCANSASSARVELLYGFLRSISFRKSDGSAVTQAHVDDCHRATHDFDCYTSLALGMVYRHAGPPDVHPDVAGGAACRGGTFSAAKGSGGHSSSSSSRFHFSRQIVHADGDPAASGYVERRAFGSGGGRRRHFGGPSRRSNGRSDWRHPGGHQGSASIAANPPGRRKCESPRAGGWERAASACLIPDRAGVSAARAPSRHTG